ncbi:ATP-binding protein [Streptomyces jumonjinensis]|uniref:ATP-binding protein n=1 Tax=Streptomyces jumonjinensis TaxID=1945 RepID=UPI0037AAA31F
MSTSPSEAVRIFTDRLRQELRAEGERAAEVPDARRGYREAACLLTHFDPMMLRLPGEERASGGAVLELLDDCTTTGMKERAVWNLKADIREQTLRGLSGPDAARQVLERNIGALRYEPGPERVCLELLSGGGEGDRGGEGDGSGYGEGDGSETAAGALAGGRPPGTGDGPGELADTLRAVLWLSMVPGMTGLPGIAGLQHRLEQARLLQPLERLVQQPFQGRTAELDRMRRFACARPAGGPGPGTDSPGLIIHGPGGMGKSTLLAKFLLDGIHGHTSGFPFAYIDFERPTLSVQEPITLIAEMARQLAIQYPDHHPELDALVDECHQTARSQREGQDRVTQLHGLATTRSVLGRSSSQEFQLLATERETGLIRRIAEILVRAVAGRDQGDVPFIMVIDSFEEAQYRGSPVLGRTWAIIASLLAGYPRLRVVVSGRSSIDHPMRFVIPEEIELAELDQSAAVGLLESCGVTDPAVARVLADRVGGHPLSLKLAARAAALAASEAEGTEELIRSLPVRRDEFFRRVDQMLVQGVLYDRILHHIADPDVRRLAHPGLVLRVITPEIIKEVLAEPCGLRVRTPEEAARLFDELSRLDLVEPAGPGAVRHRADVRAIMLRLPGSDHTDVMRIVERRAVDYYAARDGLEERAEEIYHRLRLGENPRTVEERWLPGVERFLGGARQDMPQQAVALLTAKLGGDAPNQVMADADQEDWERIAAREVEDLLTQGFAEAAFTRLGERRPWTPCSPLHSLLAETLNRLGRQAEARATVSEAISAAGAGECAERQLELLLLSARLSEEAGDLASADHDLRRAEDIAVDLGQDLEAMGALLARARLAARADTAGGAHAELPDAGAGNELARKLRLLPADVLADQPVLVRAVASQVYTRDPGVLEHAVKIVGLPTDDEALETLGTAIRSAATRQPTLLGPLMGILRDAAGPTRAQPGEPAPPGPGGAGPSDTTGILRLARDRGTLDTLARRLLAVPDESGEIKAAVAAAMGAGTAGRPADRTGAPQGDDTGSGRDGGQGGGQGGGGGTGAGAGSGSGGSGGGSEGDGRVRPDSP